MKRPRRRVAFLRRALSLAAVSVACAGCFALFDVEGYGPAIEADDGGGGADATLDARADVDAGFDAGDTRLVFLTREAFAGGTLSSNEGADELCELAARDAGLDASFMALIGDRNAPAATRVSADGGALVTVTGELVARSVTDLFASGPAVAIDVDPLGARVEVVADCFDGGTAVWTGAFLDGGEQTWGDCSNWASVSGVGIIGRPLTRAPDWLAACYRSCAESASLYCIER